jgi:hypothetical protein
MSQPKPHRLPLWAFVTLVLTVTQFLLGMDANLFFTFPETGSRWAAASTGLVGLHVILGTLLLVVGLVVLVLALRRKLGRWIVSAVLGLVGIAAAWWFGSSFVTADSDAASFLMSCGFALSLLAYGWGLWAGERA